MASTARLAATDRRGGFPPVVPSPCIGTCHLDPATQLCGGCARSGAEIAAWKDADPADRAQVWADLPRRRAALGIGLHRLGWTPTDILDFAAATLQLGADAGSWVVESPGIAGRFLSGGGDPLAVDRHGPAIVAATAQRTIRLAITERTRALAVPKAAGSGLPARWLIVLAVPQGRTTPEAAAGLAPLGRDGAAIHPEDRAGWLYDLGFDPTVATRTCLRTADAGLAAELNRRAGQPWAEVRAALAGRLTENPPTWVAANPIARIEVRDAGAADPLAPIDPAWSDPDRAIPAGFEVPAAFLPCAVFDPSTGRDPFSIVCSLDHNAPQLPGGTATDGMAP